MKVQPVNDCSAKNAVNEIAKRSGKDQRIAHCLPRWRFARINAIRMAEAKIAIKLKNRRCHSDALAWRLNAAPGFRM